MTLLEQFLALNRSIQAELTKLERQAIAADMFLAHMGGWPPYEARIAIPSEDAHDTAAVHVWWEVEDCVFTVSFEDHPEAIDVGYRSNARDLSGFPVKHGQQRCKTFPEVVTLLDGWLTEVRANPLPVDQYKVPEL